MAGHPRRIRQVECPDCGPVEVEADIFDGDRTSRYGPNPVSGLCPECGERLYFAPGDDPRKE